MSTDDAMSTTDTPSDTDEQSLEDRLDSQSKMIHELWDKVEALQDAVDERDTRIDELEEKLNQVDQRTDLLRLVETSDDLGPEQRAGVLVQHLQKKAQARGRRDNDEPARATIDREGAEDALHSPGLDRSTYYDEMRRAARLVTDDDLLEYRDGELVLDLESGELPETVGGVQLGNGRE